MSKDRKLVSVEVDRQGLSLEEIETAISKLMTWGRISEILVGVSEDDSKIELTIERGKFTELEATNCLLDAWIQIIMIA